MKKHKASAKDKPHPMLHGQHDGKMPKELMEKKGATKKKTAKMKKK